MGRGYLLDTNTLSAAVALAHDLVLVTRNVKDFPQPELMLHPVA